MVSFCIAYLQLGASLCGGTSAGNKLGVKTGAACFASPIAKAVVVIGSKASVARNHKLCFSGECKEM